MLTSLQISYYMDEHNNWTLNPEELERAYDEAKSRCVPKAICVINPGKCWGVIPSSDLE